MADSDDGFLSRWSRRKALVRQGGPLAEVVPPAPRPAQPEPAARVSAREGPAPDAAPVHPPPPPPPPTLDDVAILQADAADFSRFVARDVAPDVRNAALRKLFSDPHFNVMDGLDIYIEDYGRPDPLPLAMLRQLRQSRFLGLATDDDETDHAPGRVDPAAHNAGLAAPGATVPPEPDCEALPHEDADLRLQPHDAAGPACDPAGPGQEPGGGR